MDPVNLTRRCKERFGAAAPEIAHLVQTAPTLAELAFLSLTAGETLAAQAATSPLLQLGFQEAVRERYRELVAPGVRGQPR